MNPSPRGKYMDPFAYLDRLPLHPQPEPLESFSSYLLRLTEANEHRRYSDLSHLFSIPTSTFFQIADYPLRSFGVLPKRTGCSLDRLLATTLFHVAKKFRRSTLPLFFSRFFAGSLGNHLRYCPACLREAPYYSLLWRFLALPGCEQHQTRLLEQCGWCGSKIPLFRLPARIGICPACGVELHTCRADQLTRAEQHLTTLRTGDLTFLFAPHALEEEVGLERATGQRWTTLRRTQRYLRQEMAERLKLPKWQVINIEQGSSGQGGPLLNYFRYADVLGIPLQAVFDLELSQGANQLPVTQDRPILQTEWQVRRRRREADLVAQVQAVIHEQQSRGEPVSLEGVSKYLGVTYQLLQHYPAVNALFDLESLSSSSKKEVI